MRRIAVGLLLAALLGLLGFYVLRPTASPDDERTSAELSAQMNASEKQWDNRQAAAERERQELL